ncbi:MAG TPA: M15 family metallopeptidase [Gemmatimonadaceae bacterium]|nr:M15 family metallopeptidase [Gemmatimonadaceae bacterium]
MPSIAVLLAGLLVVTIGCSRPAPGDRAAGDTAAAVSAEAGPTPDGTAAQAESLLVDIRQLDQSIVVEARYATTDNFTGAPLPGYEANRALLRREAAVALARVQARLRSQGLGLKVFDGYRPVRATGAMMEWTERTGRQDLVRDGYIAERSRHNLGVAIDLTLVELGSGRELDMGTAYDEFTPAAHTASAVGVVAERRATLVSAMESEGFTNYEREWWHFSYQVPEPLRFDVTVR